MGARTCGVDQECARPDPSVAVRSWYGRRL